MCGWWLDLVIHDYNKLVSVYSHYPKDGHKIGYQDPQSWQKFILMINQAIHIDGLDNHLLCPMQCQLSGEHISEGSNFLADSPSQTTHDIELVDPFDAAQPLIIQFS